MALIKGLLIEHVAEDIRAVRIPVGRSVDRANTSYFFSPLPGFQGRSTRAATGESRPVLVRIGRDLALLEGLLIEHVAKDIRAVRIPVERSVDHAKDAAETRQSADRG